LLKPSVLQNWHPVTKGKTRLHDSLGFLTGIFAGHDCDLLMLFQIQSLCLPVSIHEYEKEEVGLHEHFRFLGQTDLDQRQLNLHLRILNILQNQEDIL